MVLQSKVLIEHCSYFYYPLENLSWNHQVKTYTNRLYYKNPWEETQSILD